MLSVMTEILFNDDRAGQRQARPFQPSRKCRALPAGHMMGAGMGDLVNLKQFKKRTERQRSEKQAATNRARFGRTKSERMMDERRSERANDSLDQHRIDGEDAS
jgi:Domain of unknown function (DUF4169)